jgi:hypothetical protein
MSKLSQIKKGIELGKRKPITLFYAVEKFGKSTFAAQAPSPIFLDLEDGLIGLDVEKTPQIKSYDEFEEWLTTLSTEKHGYKTVIVDTVTKLEELIVRKICDKLGLANVEEFHDNHNKQTNFGAGAKMVAEYMKQVLEALRYIRDEKGVNIYILGHAKTKEIDDIENGKMSKYVIQLMNPVMDYLYRNVDLILFGNYKIITKTSDSTAFGGEKKKVATKNEPKRYLFTGSTPTSVNGGRVRGLPSEIELPGSDNIDHMYETFEYYLNKTLEEQKNGKNNISNMGRAEEVGGGSEAS